MQRHYRPHWALSLLTSFEGKFVRFSCLVVVESPDRQPGLAVIRQHVLAVIFVKLLVVKWIGILRTVAETFKQLVRVKVKPWPR